jgi:hypothetical protein
MRKTSGRIHWMFAVGAVGIVLVAVILLSTGGTPTSAGIRFLNALGSGDVNTLVEAGRIAEKSAEEEKEAWEFTLDVAQHYRFKYAVLGELNPSPDRATLRLNVWRNHGPASYEEPFDLPMVKEDGKWLVDVKAMSREMFPALPR